MENNNQRYSRIAITLHWAMALAFLLMIGSGLAFDNIEMDKSFKFSLYQWHKSLGLTVLVLAVIRLLWRAIHRPPALPSVLSKFDNLAAHAGHWALYALMFGVPLSGWYMVSSSSYGLPTIYFGWFEWPHLPVGEYKKVINDISREAHEILAFAFMGMIGIHIAAALKHEWFDKVPLLHRMGLKCPKRNK